MPYNSDVEANRITGRFAFQMLPTFTTFCCGQSALHVWTNVPLFASTTAAAHGGRFAFRTMSKSRDAKHQCPACSNLEKLHARELREKDREIKRLREWVASLDKKIARLNPEPTSKRRTGFSFRDIVSEPPREESDQKVSRKPIPAEMRRLIYSRDENACVYCGATEEDEPLNIDHVVPVTRGGLNEFDNLVTACQSCNFKKGTMLIEEWDQEVRLAGFESLQDYLQKKMRARQKIRARAEKKA